ncbi:response regulator [Sulfurimonas sp. HSL-1716]|uniref:response regulator transcription factor n=1 Tax=Hydrocurvibacter sulfurireducens TaxID=3131937 RepID=UPI0031F90B94
MTKNLILNLQKIAKDIHLLYVEDDLLISSEVKKLLQKIFSHVDTAQNGKEGLELYKKKPYDIVVTDITMPEMNGIEMTKEIKKINDNQTIIITSAYNDSKYLIEMIEIGVDKFIMKPLDIKKFFVTISKIVVNLHNEKKKAALEHQLSEELKIKDILLEKLSLPVIILDGPDILYANAKFIEYFRIKDSKNSLKEFPLKTIFKDKDLSSSDNLTISDILRKDNGSTRTLIMGDTEKTQRYTINVTSVQGTNKTLLCFFNVEEMSVELDKLKNINNSNFTGLFTRESFVKDIRPLINMDNEDEYTIICFGLKHIEKFIQRFGAVNLHDIYQTIAKKLLSSFQEELQNDTLKIYYFTSNHYVAIAKNDISESVKERIKEFYRTNNYTQLFTSEPITLDFISISLDKKSEVSKILADIENKLYMLLK